MRSVVITGVSTGIGLATVEAALRAGFEVFGSVRSQEDAVRLSDQFPENFVPLVFDVTDESAVLRGRRLWRRPWATGAWTA